jgi:hypothetical protein
MFCSYFINSFLIFFSPSFAAEQEGRGIQGQHGLWSGRNSILLLLLLHVFYIHKPKRVILRLIEKILFLLLGAIFHLSIGIYSI